MCKALVAQQKLQAKRAGDIDIAPIEILFGTEDLQEGALAVRIVVFEDIDDPLDLVEAIRSESQQQLPTVAGARQCHPVGAVAPHARGIVLDEG
ncbi:hypothetical protein [Breoghania sp.]|uniref:hypothetical protein n=1 Tax=Breoghania sp. TaxID=2065378 RepID=UPI0026342298|nr:hypothetical protein [Breoghania sp.]MDJ0931254.1 hypothetical protein [Breoghania sp.]